MLDTHTLEDAVELSAGAVEPFPTVLASDPLAIIIEEPLAGTALRRHAAKRRPSRIVELMDTARAVLMRMCAP
jgi:hypothetical protein